MNRLLQKQPIFARYFSVYFNCDVVDWHDPEDVRVHVISCAVSVVQEVRNIDELLADLKEFLDHWNDDIIDLFSELTDTAFDFDEFWQEKLWYIITELISQIQNFRNESFSCSRSANGPTMSLPILSEDTP